MATIFEKMKHFVRAYRLLEQEKKCKASMKFYIQLAWAGKEV